MEDDYYYDDDGAYDDYYDAEGNGAIEDFNPLETKYIDGKSYMHNNPEESLRCLTQVIDEDDAHGLWTFKALKMLTRTSRLLQQYEAMNTYYDRVVHFDHPDVSSPAVVKAMLKFIDENQQVPDVWQKGALQVTLDVAAGHPEAYQDVVVPALLRRVDLLIAEGKYKEALTDLEAARKHCVRCFGAVAQLNATPIYHINALKLVALRKLGYFAELRRTYDVLGKMNAALPPLRLVGIVMESAGHLFLHDEDWAAAHQAFCSATRCFTESGESRLPSLAKFVVVAVAMAGSSMNVFPQEESNASHDADRPVRALWDAFAAVDIPAFLQVLHNPANAAIFAEDEDFAPYMDVLTFRLRSNYLASYFKSFAALKLSDLFERLQVSEKEGKELCCSAILQGIIHARIDDARHLLVRQREPALNTSSGAAVLRNLSKLASTACKQTQ